jgi:hypothetical protein
LERVFSVGSALRLHNEDPRPAELIIESAENRQLKITETAKLTGLTVQSSSARETEKLTADKSSAQAAVTRGHERWKLNNLHCYKPLPGNG